MSSTIPPLMHAVVMHERGGSEVLRYETVPTPQPAADEVLIKVQAASINHTDIFHRTGQFFIQKDLPHILGMDVAGEIVQLGEKVSKWRVGDRVLATFEGLGRERNGAYAEYTTLPAHQLYRIPEDLDYIAAASIGLAFTTAWIALFYSGEFQEGQFKNERERFVIHAASSGVGSAALQIAHKEGAFVIAISDMNKAERLRSLGADVVIYRNAPDSVQQVMQATDGKGATFVLELVGRATLQSSVEMLTDDGRIVCVGTLSGDMAEFNVMDLIMKRGSIKGSFGTIARQDMEWILQRFAKGVYQPVIDVVLPLKKAKEAHERIEAKDGLGKVILVP